MCAVLCGLHTRTHTHMQYVKWVKQSCEPEASCGNQTKPLDVHGRSLSIRQALLNRFMLSNEMENMGGQILV